MPRAWPARPPLRALENLGERPLGPNQRWAVIPGPSVSYRRLRCGGPTGEVVALTSAFKHLLLDPHHGPVSWAWLSL